MRTPIGPLTGALLSIALLGACSREADNTVEATPAPADAATAEAASGAAGGPADPGGAISPPPANGNEAVNADGAKINDSLSPGSNSFTEGQARGHIENAGYADVTGLTKTPEGMWTGKAKKDGKVVNVSVDFKGAVTAQ